MATADRERGRAGPARPTRLLIPDGLLVVLAVCAGATDALSYLGLGRVFTSAMTGNLVLLGIAAGSGAVTRLVRSLVSLIGYLVGVVVAARFLAGVRSDERHRWPDRVTAAIGVEAALQVLLAAGWLAAGARPSGIGQHVLVVVSALAMGFQARAVQTLAVPAVSTTYLTGTLITLTSWLATGGPRHDVLRAAAVVAAMLAGAALDALLLDTARGLAPFLPLACSLAVVVTGLVFHRLRQVR